MNRLLLTTWAKTTFIVALSTLSVAATADAKQDITDARQETQIWTTYALSPYLRAHELKVTVHEGKAVLSGKVDEDVNKDLAKEIALGVEGIKEVDNQIQVEANYSPKNTRGYGEVIDDVTITAAVKSRLVWSKYSFIDAKVESKAGRVVLTGSVDSKEAKTAATRLASATRGVVAVNNQLMVGENTGATGSAKQAANETGKAVADAWITAKVKSNFFYSNNVSGSDIEVSTHSGVVNLKGKVASGAERALAIELAENIRGVKNVNAKELVF